MHTSIEESVPGQTTNAEDSARDRTIQDLFCAHRVTMIRLAVLLVDDLETAEDVTQEAFMSLYRRFEALRDVDAAVGYLRRCVLNGSRSALRRRRVARLTPDWIAATGPAASAESAVILADDQSRVVAALRALPRRQREVIVLRYWADLSEREIAQTLRVSVGVVKSSASRGRSAMAKTLGGI